VTFNQSLAPLSWWSPKSECCTHIVLPCGNHRASRYDILKITKRNSLHFPNLWGSITYVWIFISYVMNSVYYSWSRKIILALCVDWLINWPSFRMNKLQSVASLQNIRVSPFSDPHSLNPPQPGALVKILIKTN